MTFTSYPLIEHERHLLLENRQGLLVIDTGSPVSFHEDGIIELGDCKMDVSESVFGMVDSHYLSKNIGTKIKGLLGMDFMGKHTTFFNTQRFGGFVSFEDERDPGRDALDRFSVGGCPGIVMMVNGRHARMLVDSGANLSYIDEKFVMDAPSAGQKKDFSPMFGVGVFTVDTYEIPCHIGCGNEIDKDLQLVFGLPPIQIGSLLRNNNVDGIIGYDLFKNFRISLLKGQVAFPPQGI